MMALDTPCAPTAQRLEQDTPAHSNMPDERTGRFTLVLPA